MSSSSIVVIGGVGLTVLILTAIGMSIAAAGVYGLGAIILVLVIAFLGGD